MTYEIWDLTTRNISGLFATESEALQAVRTAVEMHGQSYAEAFALVREDAHGCSKTIARGKELVDRALAPDGRNRISV